MKHEQRIGKYRIFIRKKMTKYKMKMIFENSLMEYKWIIYYHIENMKYINGKLQEK